jgi:hypothetical protein
MADKYIALDTATGRFKQVDGTVTSSGSAQSGKIPALGTDGKLDASLIPSGVGGDSNVQSVTVTESVSAGDWVNFYNNGGSLAARKALAGDTSKPAHAFVLTSAGSGTSVNANLGGTNTKIPVAGFSAADIGKEVFLPNKKKKVRRGGAPSNLPVY